MVFYFAGAEVRSPMMDMASRVEHAIFKLLKEVNCIILSYINLIDFAHVCCPKISKY